MLQSVLQRQIAEKGGLDPTQAEGGKWEVGSGKWEVGSGKLEVGGRGVHWIVATNHHARHINPRKYNPNSVPFNHVRYGP